MAIKDDFNNLKSAAQTLILDNAIWLEALNAQVDQLSIDPTIKATAKSDMAAYTKFDKTLGHKLPVNPPTTTEELQTQMVSLLEGFLIWTEELYDLLQKDLPSLLENEVGKAGGSTTNPKKSSPDPIADLKAKGDKVKADRNTLRSLLAPWLTPTLMSISLTPPNPTLQVGASTQLKANAVYSDGSQQDVTSQTTWKVDNATIATITNTGLVTSKTVGSTLITATYNSQNAQVSLTVTASQNIFLDQMSGVIGQKDPAYNLTFELFERRNLQLRDAEIGKLTESWGRVITSFTDSTASSVEDPKMVSQYLQMHSKLQTLYDRLTTHVTRLDEGNQILELY